MMVELNTETMRKFKRVYIGDDDAETYQRVFSGRLTKGRYKALQRYCKSRTRSGFGYCGHDWDCCGCVCRTEMELAYKHNLVTLTYIEHRNF